MDTTSDITVLLVEDDADHAELIREAFEELTEPVDLRNVEDGQAALDYLCHRGAFADQVANPRPKVVLLDLRLPRKDGLEVLADIKVDEDLRAIPIVVLSSSNASRDIAQAYALNANGYVVKPLAFESLIALADLVARFWGRFNEQPIDPKRTSRDQTTLR